MFHKLLLRFLKVRRQDAMKLLKHWLLRIIGSFPAWWPQSEREAAWHDFRSCSACILMISKPGSKHTACLIRWRRWLCVIGPIWWFWRQGFH
ncbi:unnamed protein product [Trifolium pratense]|uniref:Uncharacterized protein n=1 Tax=Trifolium pratense TaxID=57577 RepID=A0ACB0ISK7_TRIPR|nr:unnamed protein product [Trifolium pratense]